MAGDEEEEGMTSEERVAFINAMVACAEIEAKGMEAENQHRLRISVSGMGVSCSNSIAYGKDAFDSLIDKYGIHHNAVLGYLRDLA